MAGERGRTGRTGGVLDRVDDAVFAVDDDWRFTYANDAAAALLERPAGTLPGTTLWEAFPELPDSRFEAEFRRAMERREPTTFEERFPPTGAWLEVGLHPDADGLTAFVRDVSDRKDREAALRHERALTEELLDTSPVAIVVLDGDGQFVRANDRAEAVLGVSRGEITGRAFDAPDWNTVDGDGEPVPADVLPFEQVRRTGDPVYGHEHAVERPDSSEVWLSINAAPTLGPHGDVEHVVATLEDVTESRRRERTLRQRRDELETLTRISGVVQEVVRELTDATTRAEIEQTVCERLAASDFYETAVVGGYDRAGGVSIRRSAGLDAGLVDALEAAHVAGDETLPLAEAMRTGEVRVFHDLDGDDHIPGSLADSLTDRDILAGIVVPLAYEGWVYGFLGVGGNRSATFSADEQTAFEVLGETIAFAVNALERKEALATDRVVEVEFELSDPDHVAVAASAATGATFDLEGVARRGRETYLEYVTVSGAEPDRVRGVVDEWPAVADYRTVTEEHDGALFEFVVAEDPVLSTLAQHGATLGGLTAEGGDATVVAEVPRSTEVRAVVDAFEAAFDGVAVNAQRQTSRSTGPVEDFRETVEEATTAKQWDALKAAYLGGFFEWPRESTAEELAESKGLSSSTYHQHLRIAQCKLLRAFFEG